MKIKGFLALLITLFSFHALAYSADSTGVRLTTEGQAWLQEHPVIRVHNEINWPPINYNKTVCL